MNKSSAGVCWRESYGAYRAQRKSFGFTFRRFYKNRQEAIAASFQMMRILEKMDIDQVAELYEAGYNPELPLQPGTTEESQPAMAV